MLLAFLISLLNAKLYGGPEDIFMIYQQQKEFPYNKFLKTFQVYHSAGLSLQKVIVDNRINSHKLSSDEEWKHLIENAVLTSEMALNNHN